MTTRPDPSSIFSDSTSPAESVAKPLIEKPTGLTGPVLQNLTPDSTSPAEPGAKPLIGKATGLSGLLFESPAAEAPIPFVTRFAPSPTGRLHLGHAYAALTVWEAARAAGGRVLLRIEDIDRTRRRPEFEQGIYDDLAWLGLAWEEPVRRQSEHLADHEAALERVREQGVLYRCFRTRKEIAQAATSAPHGPEAPYRGAPLPSSEEADRLAKDEPFAWRLSQDAARTRMGAAFDELTFVDLDAGVLTADPGLAGDVVLARKDVGVAYHLASVVDDALQGVTQVIRGDDLREAVHVQRLLQALLGLPTPSYRHHRLLLGPDGKRLAKRNGARSLRELREGGSPPPRTAEEAAGLARSGVARAGGP